MSRSLFNVVTDMFIMQQLLDDQAFALTQINFIKSIGLGLKFGFYVGLRLGLGF